MNKTTICFLMVIAAVMASRILVRGQETMVEEENPVAYGTVVAVSTEKIVINEYDIEIDEMANVTYAVNKKTKIENAGEITDIKISDAVDLEYKIINGKKVAIKVVLEIDTSDEVDEEDAAETGDN